jgi:hypothetical protein
MKYGKNIMPLETTRNLIQFIYYWYNNMTDRNLGCGIKKWCAVNWREFVPAG